MGTDLGAGDDLRVLDSGMQDAMAVCAPGAADCNNNLADGCEVRIDSDPRNCGGCGVVCMVPAHVIATCAMGVCGQAGCEQHFVDCNKNLADGCEVRTDVDIDNCGGCGLVCMPPPNTSWMS